MIEVKNLDDEVKSYTVSNGKISFSAMNYGCTISNLFVPDKNGKPVDPMHMETIEKNLPQLTKFCDMKPYHGDKSYQSLFQYMKEAENILSTRGNRVSLRQDALMASLVREHGKEAFLQLKRDNFNTKLEDCVIGMDQKRMLDVIDGYIVPRTGLIFLTPQNHYGRAPFYSHIKIVGDWHIKTLWFNISVLLLMCLVVGGLLFSDCPGRYLRKDNPS